MAATPGTRLKSLPEPLAALKSATILMKFLGNRYIGFLMFLFFYTMVMQQCGGLPSVLGARRLEIPLLLAIPRTTSTPGNGRPVHYGTIHHYDIPRLILSYVTQTKFDHKAAAAGNPRNTGLRVSDSTNPARRSWQTS